MTPQKSLQEMGLSDQESSMYLVLLKSGGLPASVVAKEVGLRRTTAYASLKVLAQKGFVTVYVKRGRQIFVPEKPQNVAGYFEKKLKSFLEFIPALESLEKTQLQTSGLRFIESMPELKRFYASILREYRGRSYMSLGNAVTWQGLDRDFFLQYWKDRGAANIHTRILITHDSRAVNSTDPRLLREVRFLPPQYKFNSTIDILDDKALITGSDQSALGIVIAVPAMVGLFRSVFDMLWNFVGKFS